MADLRYSQNVGAVFALQYRIVWCTNGLRWLINGEVRDTLEALLFQRANELGIEIKALELTPYSVDIIITAHPTDAPQRLVAQLKSHTSHFLCEKFPHMKSRLSRIWNRRYFISSVGGTTDDTIENFILSNNIRRTRRRSDLVEKN